MIILTLFISGLIIHTFAIFEDQLGKSNWYSRQTGCPNELWLVNEDCLFVSSKDVVARINARNGEIGIISFDGSHLRIFDFNSGVLNWQKRLVYYPEGNAILFFSKNQLSIISKNHFWYSSVSNNIKSLKEVELDIDTEWFDASIGENSLLIFGFTREDNKIVVKKVQKDDALVDTIFLPSTQQKLCVAERSYLICIFEHHVIHFDLESTTSTNAIKSNFEAQLSWIRIIRTFRGPSRYFFIGSTSSIFFCAVNPTENKIDVLMKMEPFDLYDLYIGNEKHETSLLITYSAKNRVLLIYDIVLNKLVSSVSLNDLSKNDFEVPIKQIKLVSTSINKYTISLLHMDCRINTYAVNLAALAKKNGAFDHTLYLKKIWTRFEGLSSISSIEMVDFPLSYVQTRIENEFDLAENLLKSFILRLQSQLEQLQHSLISFADSLYESFQLVMKNRISLSTALLKAFNIENSGKPTSSAIIKRLDDAIDKHMEPLERDYFNTKKIIVATTLVGTIYGINNDNGQVLWSIYLGENATPFVDHGRLKIPLYIQRGTSFFQYKSKAAALFNLKGSSSSSLISFDPVSGEVFDKMSITGGVFRTELLPFPTDHMLHPLLLLTSNGEIQYYPPLPSNYRPLKPTFFFSFDVKSGQMRGNHLNFEKQKFFEIWRAQLPGFDGSAGNGTNRIVSINGKSFSQKVHSQGKVLGDRSVLYKYSNPNLIAIASINDLNMELHISLVDGVSGSIVYSGKHDRVHEPVNFVHCENWIAYTYWNEKARRTELSLVELYEGFEQTNPDEFNSFNTINHPVQALVQSYIFPQGVTAMTFSETDQGLTSRSVLVALGFGAITELSRRFVDARRPAEMTPEMREEMIIPYIPELPLATEDLITYNQTVFGIKAIKSVPSGLESTSLIFAYGLDLFYSRVTPSGTFDILKNDFDYVLIVGVVAVLILASVLAKKFCRRNSIKQAWA